MQKVKNYSYIKRSDISVLKATIDGKLLDVDPKTILSGTYVAGKIKPTASKIRVAKTNPSNIREKILKMYKDWAEDEYNKDFENYIQTEDIQKFVECGLTEEMIIAFYCGIQSVVDIKADNEFSYNKVSGIFVFRTDDNGKWIKSWIERGLYNCQNGVYEIGFKYPDFDWAKVGMRNAKTEVVLTLPYDYFGKERVDAIKIEAYQINPTVKVLAIKSGGYSQDGVWSTSYDSSDRDPKVKLELNGGYLALVSRNSKVLFLLAKKLLSQTNSYAKDFDWLVQSKTHGVQELTSKNINYKFSKGGIVVGDSVEFRNWNGDIKKGQITEDLGNGKYQVSYASGNALVDSSNLIGKTEIEQSKKRSWLFEKGGKMYATGGNTQVAETIAQQLGGTRRLQMMTGAYGFGTNGNDLRFRIKNRKVNYIKIVLNGKDLYDVEFGRVSGTNYKVISTFEDVYFDNLIPLFEKNTGMYLRFERGGRIDLFEDYENQPSKVAEILSKYELEESDYTVLEELKNRLETETGFTFEYGLDAQPYGLRPVGVELNELEGYEDENYSMGGLMGAKMAKDIAPKSFDAADEKMAERVRQKSSWEKLNETSTHYAKGGNLLFLKKHGIRNYIEQKEELAKDLSMFKKDQRFYVVFNHKVEVVEVLSQEHFDAYRGISESPIMKNMKSPMTTLASYINGKRTPRMPHEYSLEQYAYGGGIEDRDFVSSARTSARESINWDEEVRNYAGDQYNSLTDEEKESIIAEMKEDWDFQHSFAKGGKLSETKYIPRDAIVKVQLKNDRVIENHWNNPIYSGLRLIEGRGAKVEREELERKGQLSIFKRGGSMPKYSKYISNRDIAKVFLEDDRVIQGADLVGGIWYDNTKTEKLIEDARKRGLIK
jgi:hypothetical protein